MVDHVRRVEHKIALGSEHARAAAATDDPAMVILAHAPRRVQFDKLAAAQCGLLVGLVAINVFDVRIHNLLSLFG